MILSTDIFRKNLGFIEAMGIEQRTVFENLLVEVAKELYPLQNEINAEEKLSSGDDFIGIVVNLLQGDEVTVSIIGYSASLTYRMKEIADAIDFEIIGENIRKQIEGLNN